MEPWLLLLNAIVYSGHNRQKSPFKIFVSHQGWLSETQSPKDEFGINL